MDFASLAIVISLPLLLAASAWCSAMETALFSLSYQDRVRLRKLSPTAARAAGTLLEHPRGLLVSILLVNMLANTLYLVLTALLSQRLEQAWMQISLAVFNVLLMTIVGEVVSKLLAGRLRVELAKTFAPGVLALTTMLGPVRTFMDEMVITPLVRVILPDASRRARQRAGGDAESARLSEQELSELIDLGHEQGALDRDEVAILDQVVALGTLRVRDVMTPRVDMKWIDEKTPAAKVTEIVRARHLTRLPVCVADGEPDDGVIGILNTKRYLANAARNPGASVKDYMEPVHYVPERASLSKMLDHFRSRGIKIALCVDEHGAIVGVIATADVARRLMVELHAGSPGSGSEMKVEMVGIGAWSVPGRMAVREWAAMFGVIAERNVTTIAGLVMDRLGRLPVVGDCVRLGNVELQVEQIRGRVADRVRVSLVPTDQINGGGNGGAQ